MQQLRFYIQHSIRTMLREKQRTAFALFCVAAGVAAVVGLQNLGFIITDAMIGNTQASNRGDLAIILPMEEYFLPSQMKAFAQSVTDGKATGVTYLYHTQDLKVSVVRGETSDRAIVVDSFLVETGKYPFYGEIRALDPPDVPLADLFTNPADIVIGKSLADRQNINVGDKLRMGTAPDLFTVQGIVPISSVGDDKSNLTPVLIGFVLCDYQAGLELFELEPVAQRVYLKTATPEQAKSLATEIGSLVPAAKVRTVDDLLEQNSQLANGVRSLILTVGLLALLIGGVGIVNTMLVVVGRRTLEIAVLKTLGLKGQQVTSLFLVEAVILGAAGSLVGIALGLGVSWALIGLAGRFMMQDIAWQVYSLPLLTGLVVGVIVTAVFGFLPTLAAGQTRPSLVLRPTTEKAPQTGRLVSLAIVLLLTAVMGLLAGLLLDNLVIGLFAAYGTLVILAMLIGVMWVMVWGLSKLPSLGWIQLKLSLRGISRDRGRAASTLLALVVGIFTISLITILASSVFGYLRQQAADLMGADLLLILPAVDDQTKQEALNELNASPGALTYAEAATFSTRLRAINGDLQAYKLRIAAYEAQTGEPLSPEARKKLDDYFAHIGGRDLTANRPTFAFDKDGGRNLTAKDNGQPVVVLQMFDYLKPLGLEVGDELTFSVGGGGTEFVLEIVGLSTEGLATLGSPIITSLDVLSSAEPVGRSFFVTVEEDQLDGIVTTLTRALPGAIVLETNYVNDLLNTILEQFAPFPILVAILTLFAAAVIIANSVALATMERRREIGVMKAIGVKGHQVLGQLLLENGIIGVVGGIFGLAPAFLSSLVLSAGVGISSARPSLGTILALLALAVGVTLTATILTAGPASREKPFNVLHYE